MAEPIAVITIVIPPEYRPSDPYPVSAPDDPEWIFEDYDDYHYWFSRKVCRVAIYSPKTGDSVVHRASLPSVYLYNSTSSRSVLEDAFWPMAGGLLYLHWDGSSYEVGYAKYAADGEAEPALEILVSAEQNIAGEKQYFFAETDGRQLALFSVGSIYEGIGSAAQLITPEPLSGESVLVDTVLPDVYSGTYGSTNGIFAIELLSSVLNVRAKYQGF